MTLQDVFENINDKYFIKQELYMFAETLPKLWVVDDIISFLDNNNNGLQQETLKYLSNFKEKILDHYEFYKEMKGEMPRQVEKIFGLGGY